MARNKISIDDKFNSILFDDDYEVLYNLLIADILHMSDETLFTFTPKKDGSSLGLISAMIPDVKVSIKNKLRSLIKNIFNFHYPFDMKGRVVEDEHFSIFTYSELATKLAMFSGCTYSVHLDKAERMALKDNFTVELSK